MVYGFLIIFLLTATTLFGNNQRNFIMIFQVLEYNSKLTDGVEYFFDKILKPQDQLTVLSPVRPYGFPPQTRQKYPLKKIIEQTKNVLKRDITLGVSNYNQTLQNMTRLVLEISNTWGNSGGGNSMGSGASLNDLKRQMIQYRQMLLDLRNLRKLNENLFIQLAGLLKKFQGEKYINIFYQKELRIVPDRDTMEALRANPRVRFDAIELFDEDRNEEFMDVEKVIQVLKDSSVVVNFFYIQQHGRKRDGMELKEFSGDVYNVLSKIANATGGKVIATSKPAAALKKTFGSKK